MNRKKVLNKTRERRVKRTRTKIFGTATKPRLSVFCSNSYSYVQLINDDKGETLAFASTREVKAKGKERDSMLGELIAKLALENKIKEAVFDRGRYKYHGRVKAIAEGARKAGLKI